MHLLSPVVPPSITPERVRKLSHDLRAREQFLRQIAADFERHYGSSLDDLNHRLQTRQIAEHPAWEDAIEWGNALDQLAQIQFNQSIVTWLINLLTPSKSS
jgi:hypothetical protein